MFMTVNQEKERCMKKALWIGTLLALSLLFTACSQPTLDELDEWDLVWISDSSGWDVAQVYADYIEEDTGKTVIVHDLWVGGLAAGDILASLNGNPPPNILEYQQMLEFVPEAEVIVIYGNPTASFDEDNTWDFNCVGGTLYVNNCDLEAFNVYIDDLSAIYQKIFELRDGKPTIIRAFDAYNPIIPNRVGTEGYEPCMACWKTYNQAIHMAAEQNNVPVAAVFEAWNGLDYSKNPVDLGYTKDSEHPSALGAEVIAQALRELGYDPVTP
jgi:hypothetical protein